MGARGCDVKFVRDPDGMNWLGEALVTLAAIGFAVVGRAVIDMFAPGVLPFALTFPAVILASLLAGVRAGVVALIICQFLVWFFVFPPRGSLAVSSAQAVSLFFSTLSLGLTVWIIGAYRAAQARLRQEAQSRVDLLSLALREVDHRTKNNFQIAASLLQSQAAAQSDPALAQELRSAASRLTSIATVYANLALSSADLNRVMLQDYLRELCARFRETMLPPTVSLAFEGNPVEISARAATTIGLIVNECLTNAAKHAFPGGIGAVEVSVRNDGGAIQIEVRDDGVGDAGTGAPGTGSTLIATLARSIRATFAASEDGGRVCTLRVPL
jgi:two-component sensor histidine kinase